MFITALILIIIIINSIALYKLYVRMEKIEVKDAKNEQKIDQLDAEFRDYFVDLGKKVIDEWKDHL